MDNGFKGVRLVVLCFRIVVFLHLVVVNHSEGFNTCTSFH